MQRRIDPALAVVLLAFLGYYGLSRLVGNLYPFSTFPMYAGKTQNWASRIVARAPDGSLHEVDAYARWACQAAPAEMGPARCPELAQYPGIPYIDREILEYVAKHPAAAAEGDSVELVRHIWHFPDGPGSPRTESCVLSRCRAIKQ